MKLSQILGRILTDVAFRQAHADVGVCGLVEIMMSDGGYWSSRIDSEFEQARKACTQTNSHVYPVADEWHNPDKHVAGRRWGRANGDGTMWRGQYGINRRKLVRDCWRWAKERDL